MRWAGHVARMGRISVYKSLIGKTDGRRPLRRPGRRLENNVRIGITELGRKDADWIHLAQARDQWRALVNRVMNLWVS
jgi:hypothetical protein